MGKEVGILTKDLLSLRPLTSVLPSHIMIEELIWLRGAGVARLKGPLCLKTQSRSCAFETGAKECFTFFLVFFCIWQMSHSVFRDGLNYWGLDVLRGGFSTSWASPIYLSRNPRLMFASHRKINLFISADRFILVFLYANFPSRQQHVA